MMDRELLKSFIKEYIKENLAVGVIVHTGYEGKVTVEVNVALEDKLISTSSDYDYVEFKRSW